MAKNDEAAIIVKDLHKTFKLPHDQHFGVKQRIVNVFNSRKGFEEQKVLKGISFEIKKGDFFGIVGRNGSGKSTLLKLLAGIYAPNKGLIQVNGSLTPFIELGVGFNPELTGRENVFLNGALLGFDRRQMESMYDDIVEFAELEKFMDQKLKNYSSGMQVRLAFSIAIRAESDILLLDEVLAVGDEAFQKKCYQYFAELKKNQKTVILVTHDMGSVQQFCNRAALIDKGHKMVVGSPAKIARIYRELNSEKTSDREVSHNKNDEIDLNARCKKTDKEITLNIDALPKKDMEDSVITTLINRNDGAVVYRWASDDKTHKGMNLVAGKAVKATLTIENIFPDGVYNIQVAVKKRDRTYEYAVFDNINRFEIVNAGPHWKPSQRAVIS